MSDEYNEIKALLDQAHKVAADDPTTEAALLLSMLTAQIACLRELFRIREFLETLTESSGGG